MRCCCSVTSWVVIVTIPYSKDSVVDVVSSHGLTFSAPSAQQCAPQSPNQCPLLWHLIWFTPLRLPIISVTACILRSGLCCYLSVCVCVCVRVRQRLICSCQWFYTEFREWFNQPGRTGTSFTGNSVFIYRQSAASQRKVILMWF